MIMLTREAVAAIGDAMNDEGKQGWGVRISAEILGCSGATFGMRFEEASRKGDVVIEIRDVRVFVDEASMSILTGTTIDYSEAPDNSGFHFDVPERAADACSHPATRHDCSCGKN
jgi:iron-sulfur cluster assembly protein